MRKLVAFIVLGTALGAVIGYLGFGMGSVNPISTAVLGAIPGAVLGLVIGGFSYAEQAQERTSVLDCFNSQFVRGNDLLAQCTVDGLQLAIEELKLCPHVGEYSEDLWLAIESLERAWCSDSFADRNTAVAVACKHLKTINDSLKEKGMGWWKERVTVGVLSDKIEVR